MERLSDLQSLAVDLRCKLQQSGYRLLMLLVTRLEFLSNLMTNKTTVGNRFQEAHHTAVL